MSPYKPGKVRCLPSIAEDTRKCTEYRMDFIAFGAIFAASSAAVWLMYSFLISLLSATTVSDLLLPADVMIYTISFALGMGGFILAYILGGWSIDLRLGSLKDIVHTIVMGLMFTGVISLVASVLSFVTNITLSAGMSFVGDVRMTIALVLLAPIGEELLYRGAGYGLINAAIPADGFGAFVFKAFTPSLLFAIGHYWTFISAGSLNVFNFAFTFFSGYALNFSYWYTKKLGVPMVAHFLWNLLQLILAGVI
jgi:membrane protease YdiL (CAAX protease family)